MHLKDLLYLDNLFHSLVVDSLHLGALNRVQLRLSLLCKLGVSGLALGVGHPEVRARH